VILLPWASEVRQGGACPLEFENFRKKGCLLDFEWENEITTFDSPTAKVWKIPLVAPWKKSFRRLCLLHHLKINAQSYETIIDKFQCGKLKILLLYFVFQF